MHRVHSQVCITKEKAMSGRMLILGASGKVGRYGARAFEAAGWEVRRYRRGTEEMAEAARGCDVIVNGLNPPNYHDWARLIPAITRDVLRAAKASGATVILPGNVYPYGDLPGPWSEATPHRPVSRKGAIRAEMERAYAESGVRTILLRAGNFIDPERRTCLMGLVHLRAVWRGKVTLLGPPATRQAVAHTEDWARAAVALATMRADLAPYEDVPLPGSAISGHDLRRSAERVIGRDLCLARFPWWAMRAAVPLWELAREMTEMRYLFETNHALSGTKLAGLLPDFRETPFDAVMEQMLRAPSRCRAPDTEGPRRPTMRMQPVLPDGHPDGDGREDETERAIDRPRAAHIAEAPREPVADGGPGEERDEVV
jgi:nucleoside-diphosphate-sugar epimerase